MTDDEKVYMALKLFKTMREEDFSPEDCVCIGILVAKISADILFFSQGSEYAQQEIDKSKEVAKTLIFLGKHGIPQDTN